MKRDRGRKVEACVWVRAGKLKHEPTVISEIERYELFANSPLQKGGMWSRSNPR